MQPGKYKVNPGLLRPLISMFNYFIGVVISYNFGFITLAIPPSHHFAISCFKHAQLNWLFVDNSLLIFDAILVNKTPSLKKKKYIYIYK